MFVGEHTFLCEGIDCFGSSLISCRAAMGGQLARERNALLNHTFCREFSHFAHQSAVIWEMEVKKTTLTKGEAYCVLHH